jgi:hypothetical protein
MSDPVERINVTDRRSVPPTVRQWSDPVERINVTDRRSVAPTVGR